MKSVALPHSTNACRGDQLVKETLHGTFDTWLCPDTTQDGIVMSEDTVLANDMVRVLRREQGLLA